jgi:arsenate reductase (glutaredoxin)
MTIHLYGIPNCDQVKKARAWLAGQHIAVEFHDFKKIDVTPALIQRWLTQMDWQILLNRRGTTWRQLSEKEQLAVVDADSAVRCMVSSPSVIKRPVLVSGTKILVGFSEENYRRLFLV